MDIMDISTPKMPVVVVTGSGGLIGSRLCRALAQNHTVIGLDVERPDPPEEGVQWVECDLTSDENVRAAWDAVANLNGREIASVVHLAAYYDFSGEPSPLYKELTVEGTRRLLRELRAFEVGQFVFSSSLLVMEPADDEEASIDETSPTAETWAYPKSKLAAERVIFDEHGNIPAVILRIAGVYDEDCHSIPLGQQISRIFEQSLESHVYPGDKEHGQPFIHIDDVVECIQKVIVRRSLLGPLEVFLVAEDELMSYEQLQDRIGMLLHGEKWTTIRVPKAIAKVGAWVKETVSSEDQFIKPWMIDLADAHYPIDVDKAKQRLDWRPQNRLSTTLEEMIRRLKVDPHRWYVVNNLGDPPTEALGTVVVEPRDLERRPK